MIEKHTKEIPLEVLHARDITAMLHSVHIKFVFIVLTDLKTEKVP